MAIQTISCANTTATRSIRIAIAIVIFSSLGCRSHQLRHDQDQMRQAVLELYTNQLMDNLIRASNGLPIVQLDYTNLMGTITQDVGGTAGDQLTFETQRNSLGVATLRRFVNFASFGFSGAEKLQLTVTANPVINNNEVYNAYLEYLTVPGRLIATEEPPPAGAAHIVRCYRRGCDGGEVYYWVPAECKVDFLRLALVTTVQRGQPLSTPEFFDNVVVRVEDDPKVEGYIVIYLKKPIPNDGGKFTVTLAGELYQMGFDRYSRPLDDMDSVPSGKKIDRILMKVSVKDGKVVRFEAEPDKEIVGKLTLPEFKEILLGQSVRIDLNYYRPVLPTSEDLLRAIRSELGLIRLDQVGR